MMNKSLLAHSAKSSSNGIYGFQQVRILKRRCAKSTLQKKSRRFRRLLKLITGRRQTEWTGATRCPNKDDPSHKRESLINRKRAIFFRLCLPCRPLAECGCSWRDGGESISTSGPAKRPCARGSITARRLRYVIGASTLTALKNSRGSFRHATPRGTDICSIQLCNWCLQKTFLTSM
jgi:hypothetical protein